MHFTVIFLFVKLWRHSVRRCWNQFFESKKKTNESVISEIDANYFLWHSLIIFKRFSQFFPVFMNCHFLNAFSPLKLTFSLSYTPSLFLSLSFPVSLSLSIFPCLSFSLSLSFFLLLYLSYVQKCLTLTLR